MGYLFVMELYERHGLLEAYRIASEYLDMQKNTTNPEEKSFCDEIKLALWKLDQI